MEKYSVTPLYAVGLEGFFGAATIVVLMPFLATLASRSTFFDLPRGWHQMVDNPAVLWSGVIVALSISFYNFFGLSVTRHVSASSRSLIVRPHFPSPFPSIQLIPLGYLPHVEHLARQSWPRMGKVCVPCFASPSCRLWSIGVRPLFVHFCKKSPEFS